MCAKRRPKNNDVGQAHDASSSPLPLPPSCHPWSTLPPQHLTTPLSEPPALVAALIRLRPRQCAAAEGRIVVGSALAHHAWSRPRLHQCRHNQPLTPGYVCPRHLRPRWANDELCYMSFIGPGAPIGRSLRQIAARSHMGNPD